MMRRLFTSEDMMFHATEAWGDQGRFVAERWSEYNARFFSGSLRPIPLIITDAQPYGRRIAFCSHSADWTGGRTITLNLPSKHHRLVADCNTLLHEMIHQFLFERGEDSAHISAGWRQEIMRLHLEITGHEIWAGRYKTVRDPTDWRKHPAKAAAVQRRSGGSLSPGGVFARNLPGPRQQLAEPLHRVIGDAGEDVGEPRPGIDIAKFCGLD